MKRMLRGRIREKILYLLSLVKNVTSVGDYAFFECENLKKIKLPDALKTIGCASFAYCSNLDAVVLPEQLNGLGDMAFFECSSLSLMVLKIAANLITPEDVQKNAADVNGDGNINSADALLILKYAAGLIQEL